MEPGEVPGPRHLLGNLFFVLYLVLLCHSKAEKQTVSDSGIWFRTEPEDVTVVPGSGAMLNCEASTALTSRPVVKWRTTDGQLINYIGDSRRSQLENGSLWIRNVRGYEDEEGGEEEYQCVASVDQIGTIVSRKAKIRAARLSPILDPPQDLTLFPGQTAYFACHAEGRPSPTVTWIKDQKPLIFEESRMTLLPSGALEIDDVKISDSGNYRCNVSGLGRHRISNKALLTVEHDLEPMHSQITPVFVGTPRETIALEGSSVTLDCSSNGYPKPDISWFKDGSNLDPVMKLLGSRFIRVGTGSLQINKIEENDAGNYQCRAENGVDSIDSHAPLIVQVTPRFVKVPKSSTGDVKKDIEFECKVTGKPEPKVMWLKNGDVINPNGYMRIVNGNNLRILGLLDQDNGIFQCVASNPAGNIQAAALLTVTNSDIRSLTSKPSGRWSGGGEDSGIMGPPEELELVMLKPRFVTLKWKAPSPSDSSPLDIKSYNVFFMEESSNRERVLNYHLEEAIISGLLPNTTYRLRVAAVTSRGLGKSTAPLVVVTKPELHVPGPPRIISVVPTTTEISVSWSPPTITNGNIHRYKLYYFESETAEEHRVETSETNYTISRLKKFTEYIVWVVAYNHNGAGANSEEVTVTTLSDVPSEPPTNITVEPASSTSVIVRWEPPPPEGRNGVITGYKLKYRMKGGRGRAETATTGGDMRMYAITGLERSSVYQVRIWAMTVNGSGPPTDWYNIETYENDLDESTVPDAPNGMRVKASADSITVLWTPPKNPNIMVRDYTIGWGKGIPDEYSGKLDGKQRSYVIKQLEANSEYVISLRAENSKGSGPPIYENVRTRDEPPPEPITPLSPPVGLKATVLSPNTVVLFWTDTALPYSQVVTDNRYYQVRYGQYHGHHAVPNPRYKYYNTTDLNYMIDDLKPFTQYEFTVKMIKGKRESAWSMVVVNTTMETIPSSPPRDVTAVNVENSPGVVSISWQPPKQPNGLITGYLVSYTTDPSSVERDWITDNIQGDKLAVIIRSLNLATMYYFHVQARNSKGYSPASPTISITTPSGSRLSNRNMALSASGGAGGSNGGSGGVSNMTLLYAIGISCAVLVIIVVAIIAVVLCCRSRTEQMSPSRSKKGYTKGKGSTSNIKPPDLWIHHDQMELKNLEKSQDQMSTSTLPREHTSTLEKQQQRDNYNPSSNYMGSQCQPLLAEEKTSTARRNIKHKPITLPVDNSPFIRESVSVGGSLTPQSSTSEARPLYPRTQYSISSRAHVTIDPNLTENPYVMHPSTSVSYEPLGTQQQSAVQTQPQPSQSNYSSGAGGSGGDSSKRLQGHPLKSFSVPAPPPQSAPTTPQQKHIVTVRPQASSPYKKAGGMTGSTGQYSGAPTVSTSPLPSKSKQHTADDLPKIQPSYSTEELNQEMANLEGLMKDLNAITASEFQC